MTIEEFVEELEKSCGISISIEQYDNDSTIQFYMKVDGGVDDLFMLMNREGSEINFLYAFEELDNSQKADVLRVVSDYIRDLSEKKIFDMGVIDYDKPKRSIKQADLVKEDDLKCDRCSNTLGDCECEYELSEG